eukprot:TRINITY_DN6423_c0_g1_i2.p1 TRINITY_DN6423_c0_g1~~TRINITY_DN6423_c0_g1_i2.p1  ORF type:complete len:534 (-),score=107.73 TRINITY_DN6423_c0_g1_i2:60-1478(-)
MRAAAKIAAPPLCYITGEEFTRYAGQLYLDKWITPWVDTSKWEFFDLSVRSRDATDDGVLKAAIAAGKRIGAIYKEPTVTPTQQQKQDMGLKKAWGSPNGAMRRGWNGVSISRDTLHIEGLKLGYKKPVLFDRHAVGGEYGAGFQFVPKGRSELLFYPASNPTTPITVDARTLKDSESALVCYDNPYDNISAMAHHFFSRCLDAGVPPCVVTKKTVFKWQEGFWTRMKSVYDASYKARFLARGITKGAGDLQHFLSDVASMQLIRWSEGGFGMASLNYDGDLLTDELAQIHRSPGFLSSVLNGIREDGAVIKEYEASHGTVSDMYRAHLRGEQTSLNPLSMMEALIGAMQYSAKLHPGHNELVVFGDRLRKAIHSQMVSGQATRDIDKTTGLTTEQFVDAVAQRLVAPASPSGAVPSTPEKQLGDVHNYDEEAMRKLFASFDTNNDGTISFSEFSAALKRLGVAPRELEAKL